MSIDQKFTTYRNKSGTGRTTQIEFNRAKLINRIITRLKIIFIPVKFIKMKTKFKKISS